jgi:carboxylesterase type B
MRVHLERRDIHGLTLLDPLASSQFTQSVFNNPAVKESEDCMYLNVYAPSSPRGSAGKAVLFWIFGGSLQFGSAGRSALVKIA